jgi:orotidine-5'-phosphate decarboxylase
MNSKIIIALQNMTNQQAIEYAQNFQDFCWGFKIKGFLANPLVIKELKKYGKVMVDPKLHDTPMDMIDEINNYIISGADIITIHAAAGLNTNECSNGFYLKDFLVGVTILTTMTDEQCIEIYTSNVINMVQFFSKKIKEYGYKYSVCSAKDLKDVVIKDSLKDVIKICPGIRPEWSILEQDDQKRFVTPKQAIELGADLLVIGKPILKAKNPLEALFKTKMEIGEIHQLG